MNLARTTLGLLGAILFALPGCSGSDGKGTASVAQNECGIASRYEGDENCILPPPPAEGFQIHVGPTNYDDPNELAEYLLDAGAGDEVKCWYLTASNDHAMYNRKRQYRLRPHTHHLRLLDGDATKSGVATCPQLLQPAWGGSQSPVHDTGFKDGAPEDADFASHIDVHKPTVAELHYYNTSDAPILREAWVNFYEADPNHPWIALNGMAFVGQNGLSVPPKTTMDLRWSTTNTVQGRRIVGVVGHVHAHTTRLSTWRVAPDGTRTLIYELTDWEEPNGIGFNTVDQNPVPGTAAATETGVSGILRLDANDRVEWECHVANTLDTTLVFANEALTAEMCIVFGSTPDPAFYEVFSNPILTKTY